MLVKPFFKNILYNCDFFFFIPFRRMNIIVNIYVFLFIAVYFLFLDNKRA